MALQRVRPLVVAGTIGWALLSAPASVEPQTLAARCAALTGLQIPGIALDVTRAEWIAQGAAPGGRGRGAGPGAPAAAALPAHCRLEGTIDRRAGVRDVSYGIGFALVLPDPWNGRFLFQGGGGLNGTVQNPLGAQGAGATPALARGFAVVSTDTGHQGQGAFDRAFMEDQQAAIDFAYIAVGRVPGGGDGGSGRGDHGWRHRRNPSSSSCTKRGSPAPSHICVARRRNVSRWSRTT